MFKALASGLLISSILFFTLVAADDGCDCNEEGFWSIENLLLCQKVSDFLIAVAYFSIPIELLCFISCSNIPFKWVLFQFIAFIVLCGMTHLLNGWTYGPHPFQIMLALTVFKCLTALVSTATAITLVTLIPLLLKVKVREFMLKKKTWDLDREVGIIMKQREAGWHVRMLTQEIRKSLDRHTILYTTLVELSKTLDLQNCAVWMPNEDKTEMNLTHELKGRNPSSLYKVSIPITDPDVKEVKASVGVKILEYNAALAATSSGDSLAHGPVAAIRMPMLRFSNFKGGSRGTPEAIQTCYAILVLILPGEQGRSWSNQELEIVQVVADQVAVALSHAAVLEESKLMRDQLVQQNRALQQAKQDAMMASHARNSFQKVMNDGMRRPMHSIMGLLSMMQDENLSREQRTLIDAMAKTSNVLSSLINDTMDTSTKDKERFPLRISAFGLHSMIKEVACLGKCLSIHRGYGFAVEVDKSLPDQVTGDERRVFQVILHMFGNILNENRRSGCVRLRVCSDVRSNSRNDQRWATWRSSSTDGYADVKFEIGMENNNRSQFGESLPRFNLSGRRYNNSLGVEEGLSFSVCKKLVQMMQGKIWVVPDPVGFDRSIALSLRFQLRPAIAIALSESGDGSNNPNSNSLFKGLNVLLADDDDVNRAVTRRFLLKLGCTVSAVGSGFQCLSALGPAASSFEIVILDLHLSDLDGFEVANRIRKFRSRSWPLIVALTAMGDEEVCERCLQIGMNGVIKKPVLLQEISEELRRVLLVQASKVGR